MTTTDSSKINLGYSQNTLRPGLRGLHQNQSPALRVALNTIPDYTAQVEALRALDRIEVPRTLDMAPEHAIAAEIIDTVTAGGTFENLAERAHTAVTNGASIGAAHAAVTIARTQLADELDQILLNQTDRVLSSLNDQLQDVVARTGALKSRGRLATLLSAEAAIDAGRVDDMSEFRSIADHHSDIRTAQAALRRATRDLGSDPQTEISEAAIFSDVLAAFPSWAAWHDHGFVLTREHRYQRPIAPPWPHSHSRARDTVATDASTPAFLVWAVDAGVALRVPDRSQFVAEQERLQHASENPIDDGISEDVHPAARPAPRDERFGNRLMSESRYMSGGLR